jgi:hypothetical protein
LDLYPLTDKENPVIKSKLVPFARKHVRFAAILATISTVVLTAPASALAGVTREEVEMALSPIATNTILGTEAFMSRTTAKEDLAIGASALKSLTQGEDNVAVGPSALRSLSGETSKDVAIGASAMKESTTGTGDVAVGDIALFSNTTGEYNTAVGNIAEAKNTTGVRNTGVGREALAEGTTGEKNTGVGFNALNENQTGNENTAVGVDTLGSPATLHASVSKDTAIGFNAGLKAEGSGDVFLGWEAGAQFNGSNELFIANSQTPTPLIFGNFETKAATINGTLEVSETPAKPAKPAAGEVKAGPAKMVARQTTFAIVGNGTKTKWSLKHTLGSRLVTVSVQVAEAEEPGEVELPTNYKVKPTSSAEVEVTFNTAPASEKEYFITVIS